MKHTSQHIAKRKRPAMHHPKRTRPTAGKMADKVEWQMRWGM